MANEMNCGNCRFFKPTPPASDDAPPRGICRYYPPQLSADGLTAHSPVPLASEWCGKHEPATPRLDS